MPTDAKLSKALENARKGAQTVVRDIEARPDYSKKPTLQATVSTLNTYQQNLMIAEAQAVLPDATTQQLLSESNDDVQPALAALVADNIAMMNMGQLNTNRTISPTMAKANNANLAAEQNAVAVLVAQLQASPAPAPTPSPTPAPTPTPTPAPTPAPAPSPAPQGELVKLKVDGAIPGGNGAFYQFYALGQSVRIQAVTNPDTPAAHAGIVWLGGAPDFSGANNLRSVSLGLLTMPGVPQTVTATLGGKSQSVKVAVVPSILGFDVSGAVSDGNGKWSQEEGSDAPITVRAVVEPATAPAYKFLVWTGGTVDPDHPDDRRLVPADSFTDPSKPLPVEVSINLS